MASILSPKTVEFVNFRIQQEELSSRIYLSMSNWLSNKGYEGGAKLWLKYSQEESVHAKWSYDYLIGLGYQPVTPKLDAPVQNFTGFPDIINQSYDHEIVITEQCKAWMKHCLSEGDYLTMQLVNKYLVEQKEEIEKMQTFKDKLESFGVDKIALRLLDNDIKESL
jgi:ferritin